MSTSISNQLFYFILNNKIKLINNIFKEIKDLFYFPINNGLIKNYPLYYNNYVRLGDIKQIWHLIGVTKRIKLDEYKNINNICKDILLSENQIDNLKIDYNNIINNDYLTVEQKNYHCSLIYDNLKYNYTSIDSIIHNLINQINLIIINNDINTVSVNYINFIGSELINNINSEWFFNLINIYKKYGGIIPTNCYNIINFFKYNWNNLLSIHKTEIENIIEYNLGGKGASNTNIIILNLKDWINRNRLCIPEDILNLFNSKILISNELNKNDKKVLNITTNINKLDNIENSIENSIENNVENSIQDTLNELEKNNT
jgi:hypothetical protein